MNEIKRTFSNGVTFESFIVAGVPKIRISGGPFQALLDLAALPYLEMDTDQQDIQLLQQLLHATLIVKRFQTLP